MCVCDCVFVCVLVCECECVYTNFSLSFYFLSCAVYYFSVYAMDVKDLQKVCRTGNIAQTILVPVFPLTYPISNARTSTDTHTNTLTNRHML